MRDQPKFEAVEALSPTTSSTTYATADGEDEDLVDHDFEKVHADAWQRALAATVRLIGQEAMSSDLTVASLGAAVGNAKKESERRWTPTRPET